MAVNLELAASDLKKTSKSLGQRHIVALLGFLSCCLIQSNRLVLGVGIAAMVKQGHTNETSEWNSSEVSCPLPTLPPKPVAVSKFNVEPTNGANLEKVPIDGPTDITKTRFHGSTSETVQTITMFWYFCQPINAKLSLTDIAFHGEFDWSAELQGYLLGAGFLGYLITQAPAGRLADAVGSKPLLVFSNCLSGILVILSPFAARWHVYVLIVVQFLRGASQGITTPATYKMLSNWIPRTERGTLNGITVCGYPVGVVIGGLVTGLLCDIPGLGWPSAFYVWGTLTVLVAIVIQFIYYEHPVNNPWIADEELKFIADGIETKVSEKPTATPWKKIFASLPTYAYFYGLFGHYWGIGYFITVHPTFMGMVLHYSIGENGVTSCLPVLLQALSGVMASIMSRWITKNNLISLNKLRKITTSVGALGFSFCMAGILLAGCNAIINVLCFALSLFFKGVALAGIVIAGMDMTPTFAGSFMGVASTVASMGSFLVPVITGLLTTHETLSEWQKVFWLNLGVVGSSGIVYLLFGSAEVQPWNYPDDEQAVATNDGRKPTDKNLNQSVEIKDI